MIDDSLGKSVPGLRRKIVPAAILALVLALLFAGWVFLYGVTPGPESEDSWAVVVIPRGSSIRAIGDILADNQVVAADIRFVLLAKLSGYGGRVQAGEFRVDTGRTPLEVLKTLVAAKPIQYSITIPEGLRASEIAAIFSEGGWLEPQSFASLVADKEFLAKQGLAGLDSLEGYLFPDTYILTRNLHGSEKIIALMVGRFNQVWTEITARLEEKPDREKTVILASIVEKETGSAAERPLIAGVFRNRLQLGMKLQSDPTVVYGLENFTGNITRTDLQTPTPFNTYTTSGLPAGPICSPGRQAMLAVLYPAQTKDLYFVSKNDGTHHFSETLAEHNNAVQKYQRKKNGDKGK
jgi:UPF0755 protein